MSNSALNWAFSLEVKPSTAKFVLISLANRANDDGEAYPCINRLCKDTCLNRKTVQRGLKTLKDDGFIVDTGKRIGQTQSVIVYRIPYAESRPTNGPAKQALNRASYDEAGPNKDQLSRPYLGQKQALNRAIEPSGTQNNINKAHSRFVPPSVEEVSEYVNTREVKIDPQSFVDHYTANGWMRGKTKIKDWKACVRTWEKNQRKDEKQTRPQYAPTPGGNVR